MNSTNQYTSNPNLPNIENITIQNIYYALLVNDINIVNNLIAKHANDLINLFEFIHSKTCVIPNYLDISTNSRDPFNCNYNLKKLDASNNNYNLWCNLKVKVIELLFTIEQKIHKTTDKEIINKLILNLKNNIKSFSEINNMSPEIKNQLFNVLSVLILSDIVSNTLEKSIPFSNNK